MYVVICLLKLCVNRMCNLYRDMCWCAPCWLTNCYWIALFMLLMLFRTESWTLLHYSLTTRENELSNDWDDFEKWCSWIGINDSFNLLFSSKQIFKSKKLTRSLSVEMYSSFSKNTYLFLLRAIDLNIRYYWKGITNTKHNIDQQHSEPIK